MSFRCGICDGAQESGTSPTTLVTKSREVAYPPRFKGKKMIDPGGNGWEIVEEVAACKDCAANFEGQD